MRLVYGEQGWSKDEIEHQMYVNMHLKIKEVDPEILREVWYEMYKEICLSRVGKLEITNKEYKGSAKSEEHQVDYVASANGSGENTKKRSNKGELWLADTGANCHCTYKEDKMIDT